MYILGISCFYHDSAAVLLKNGIVIAAAEEERFSRVKHDYSFPNKAINFCLQKEGISNQQIDYIVFYEKPFHKFERILLNTFATAPKSRKFFTSSMKKWFFDYLWIKNRIITSLDIDPKKIFFCEHHLSHAASAFYSSNFDNSAVLSIDGVGEWTTVSWGIGNQNRLKLKEELRFPNSLGLLYSVFTDFVGFEVNEGEYKVMGLAPYGNAKYIDKINKLLNRKRDGSFLLDVSYFSFSYSLDKTFSRKFESLFGTPNKKGTDDVISYYADIAASIQAVLEEIVVDIAKYVFKQTKNSHLSYAGGVALNSKANWEIANKSGFSDLFIQPAAGDSGGALGAALWFYHDILKKPRVFKFSHSYWGYSNSEKAIINTFQNKGVKYRKFKNIDQLLDTTIDKLSKGKVIGWVQDEAEWGPRALGHRSILADPRSVDMKETVNKKIKFREGFRPFAPSIIKEESQNYFAISTKFNQSPLNYMLYVTPVKKSKRSKLAAVTHVDGTARPQLVEKAVNPLYHELISLFGKKTGVPTLLNTSFNLKGEPIVNTTEDALRTFYKSGLDSLIVGDFIINK